jgi:hypothetical protein
MRNISIEGGNRPTHSPYTPPFTDIVVVHIFYINEPTPSPTPYPVSELPLVRKRQCPPVALVRARANWVRSEHLADIHKASDRFCLIFCLLRQALHREPPSHHLGFLSPSALLLFLPCFSSSLPTDIHYVENLLKKQTYTSMTVPYPSRPRPYQATVHPREGSSTQGWC